MTTLDQHQQADLGLEMVQRLAAEFLRRGCDPATTADAMVLGAVGVAVDARGASAVAEALRELADGLDRHAADIEHARKGVAN